MRKLVGIACLVLLPLGCGDVNHQEAEYEGFTTSEWIEKLHDEDVQVRLQAATAMGELGLGEYKETVPALKEALGDADWRVRIHVLKSLDKLAPKAADAQPAVGRAMSDKNKHVLKQAIKTYKHIEMSKPSALNSN